MRLSVCAFYIRVEALYTLKHHSAESVTSDFFHCGPYSRYVLRKPWIWDNPWIVLRKAWIGRYPQFAQDNPWIAPRRAVKRKPHLREVRPGAAEILSRLCLFVNSENSQLDKWCGLYSLSLSLSLALSAMEVR